MVENGTEVYIPFNTPNPRPRKYTVFVGLGIRNEVLQNAHTGQDFELTLHGKRDIIPQPSLGSHTSNPPLERAYPIRVRELDERSQSSPTLSKGSRPPMKRSFSYEIFT